MDAANPSGRTIVDRARAGDVDAFERLVAEHQRYLFALAKSRLGDSHLAQDALQETLLKAWRSIADLKDAAALRPWLAAILVRTCTEVASKKGRMKLGGAEVLDRPAPAADEAALERKALLAEVIRELDEPAQQLLALHYSEKLSYAAIAAALQISEGTVRGRLFAAREQIRKRMETRR